MSLTAIWEAVGYPCSAWLKTLLPLWLPWAIKRLALSAQVQKQMLTISPLIAQEIWRIIKTIRETGIAAIIVDKTFTAVSAVTDRSVILVKGRVVFEGSSSALKSQPDFLQQHLGI